MASEGSPTKRRCPSCGSRLSPHARRCHICGEAMPWRLTLAGVALEGMIVVAVVVIAAAMLLWLRQSGRGLVSEAEQTTQIEIISRRPTDVPTFTAAPPPSATRPPNTPHPPTETPLPATVLHDVRSGDTLFGIAQQYGVTADQIIDLNALDRPDALWIGQQLLIPLRRPDAVEDVEHLVMAEDDAGSEDEASEKDESFLDQEDSDASDGGSDEPAAGSSEEGPPTGVPIVVRDAEKHTVGRGDTLGRIAAEYGVPIDELVRLNNDWLRGPNDTLQVGDEVIVQAAEIVTTTPVPAPAATRAGSVEQTGGTAGELVAVPFEPPGEATFPAPVPLAPAGGVTVTTESSLLRWSSAGVLPRGLYYVVAIRDAEDAESQPYLQWVADATALRVPSDFRPALGTARRLVWSVTVQRRSGGIFDRDVGVLLSPEPEWQLFTWAPSRAPDDDGASDRPD